MLAHSKAALLADSEVVRSGIAEDHEDMVLDVVLVVQENCDCADVCTAVLLITVPRC